MAKRSRIDFDGDVDSDSKPVSPPEDPPPPALAPPATPAEATPPAKPAGVICARCNVACEPVGPKVRGWVKCPKCGWKHKTFNQLQARKAALRAKQDRTAR